MNKKKISERHEREEIRHDQWLEKRGPALDSTPKKLGGEDDGGRWMGTDGEGGRQSRRANDSGFRHKCQMSQRHSGKTLLFNVAPQPRRLP